MAISEFRKEYESYLSGDFSWLNVFLTTGSQDFLSDAQSERRYFALDVETTAAPTFGTWLNGKK